MRSRFVWVSIILSVIGAGPLAAQQQPAAISPSPNAPATLTRLTLEQAREMALANNKKLQLGRMNLDEKGVAVSAARRDYFPKVLGIAGYLHLSDNLGTVLATRSRTLGGATIGPGGFLEVPTVTIPGKTIAANVVNQDSVTGAVIVAQPITKLIGVSALVDL